MNETSVNSMAWMVSQADPDTAEVKEPQRRPRRRRARTNEELMADVNRLVSLANSRDGTPSASIRKALEMDDNRWQSTRMKAQSLGLIRVLTVSGRARVIRVENPEAAE